MKKYRLSKTNSIKSITKFIEGNKPPFLIFLICAILAHIPLYFLLSIKTGSGDKTDFVKLTVFDEKNLKPIAAKPKSIEEKIEEIKETEKEELKKLKGQVVEIAKPEKEEEPSDSKYLSEFNSKVEKETKAKNDPNIKVLDSKLRQKAAVDISEKELNKEEKIAEKSLTPGKDDSLEKIKKGEMQGFEGDVGKLAKGKEKAEPGIIDAKDKEDVKGGESLGRTVPSRFLPYLNGSESMLSTPSMDYLKEIADGNETAINTKKFIYADYYNRMKRAIAHYWDPGKMILVHDPHGNIYGAKSRMTKLLIILDKKGNIATIKTLVSCGADFLDAEAINAVKMAAPFPNPPEQLLEDGKITVEFGFIVEMKR